ncbi:peptidylprolyl isomerase [Undibacterium cyanobacteriorum]|uniref:peptidylprolyl isomerase n=1 Tax=Undibacterium cyanobacteriorum TaxID=3073561 RepID=A0ABY9RLH7_9BURK|nr:peptidylprolyl isomerase [Undibacterium sp. 20NA77.5]WMW82068.1 peptidylprolyl isomerase [Undibacterium sp. 20NA77.5]
MLSACGGNADAPTQATYTLSAPPMAAAPASTPIVIAASRNSYAIKRTPSGYVAHNKNATGALVTPTVSQPLLQFNDFLVNTQIGENSKTIPANTLNSIIELYIAFFNRVPDANGLSYWIDQTKAGMSSDAMANNFYAAALIFSDVTGYSSGMSNSDFVKVIYKNVLGRNEVDAEGLAYWTAALEKPAGTPGAETRGTLIRTIAGTAHNFKGNAQYGWVADLLDNKLAVGTYFAVQHGLNYLNDKASITNGVAIAAAVTPTDTTAAKNLIGMTDQSFDLRSTSAATIVNMKTSLGDIVVELNPSKAPITVTNFLRYVDVGFYSNKIFHRVIKDFVIQGGGFTADFIQASTYPPIKLEAGNGLSNIRGSIAMARTNVADSATSQFFINNVDNITLDTYSGGYAVFGQVIAGLDVVDKIRVVPTSTRGAYTDVPVSNVVITSVTRVN